MGCSCHLILTYNEVCASDVTAPCWQSNSDSAWNLVHWPPSLLSDDILQLISQHVYCMYWEYIFNNANCGQNSKRTFFFFAPQKQKNKRYRDRASGHFLRSLFIKGLIHAVSGSQNPLNTTINHGSKEYLIVRSLLWLIKSLSPIPQLFWSLPEKCHPRAVT